MKEKAQKEDHKEQQISQEEKEKIFAKYTTYFNDWLGGRLNIPLESPSPS